jgi:hypothetical protein
MRKIFQKWMVSNASKESLTLARLLKPIHTPNTGKIFSSVRRYGPLAEEPMGTSRIEARATGFRVRG